jgi:hypothetical protein
MKEWIEKRIMEMKAENVIQLPNWAEYYNNIETKEVTEELYAYAQTLTHQGGSKTSDYKRKGTE